MPSPKSTDASFEVEERLCPLEAVQNAAYTFTDRAYVRVESASEGKLKVSMSFKKDAEPAAVAALRGEFDNELLHQALRLKVSDANRKIREFIVTKALVSAQPTALVAEAAGAAAPCACEDASAPPPAAPAPLDQDLEKEIDRLLLEIEKGGGEADPLGVSVPWEEKFAAKGAEKPKAKGKAKAKPKRKPS